MANKSNSNKKETKTTTKKSSNGGSVWSLNKISFYTLCAVAVLYLLAIIFAPIGGVLLQAARILQGVANAVMVCIVAVNAWRFVKSKQTIWKICYAVVLLVVIAGIIVPLIF